MHQINSEKSGNLFEKARLYLKQVKNIEVELVEESMEVLLEAKIEF